MKFERKLVFLSFIYTVLVIWVHAVYPGFAGISADMLPSAGLSFCFHIQDFLGDSLGQAAVPGFFCISGYLFFRNSKSLIHSSPLSFFLCKWRRRIFSLLIPYLLWNIIYYAVYAVSGRASLTVPDIFGAVFLYSYNPVFWYMHELIILAVLSPLVYFMLANRKAAYAVLMCLLIIASCYTLLPFHIVNEDAYFYYSFGAFLSLHMEGYVEGNHTKWQYLLAACAVIAAISKLINLLTGASVLLTAGTIIFRISLAVLIYAVISLITVRFTLFKDTALPSYMDYNFFIYAVHYLLIRFFRIITAYFIGENSIIYLSLGYILMPAVCIAAAVCAGKTMRRYTPHIYKILTGGRN